MPFRCPTSRSPWSTPWLTARKSKRRRARSLSRRCPARKKRWAAPIGRQLAGMHVVLARPTTDQAFAPRVSTAEDVTGWADHAKELLGKAFDVIASRKTGDNEADDAAAAELLASKDKLLAALD